MHTTCVLGKQSTRSLTFQRPVVQIEYSLGKGTAVVLYQVVVTRKTCSVTNVYELVWVVVYIKLWAWSSLCEPASFTCFKAKGLPLIQDVIIRKKISSIVGILLRRSGRKLISAGKKPFNMYLNWKSIEPATQEMINSMMHLQFFRQASDSSTWEHHEMTEFSFIWHLLRTCHK